MNESTVTRIIGIDPGFDRLGISIVDKERMKETLIFSTCITTNKTDSFEARLAQIARELTTILSQYIPQELSIETIFITKNQKTVINVAEVRGVCLYLCHTHNVEVFEYSPPQIKTAITGYGRATKDDVAVMVQRILKCTFDKNVLDDELDAIAIALTHSANRNQKKLEKLMK
jgi:crossover junction endodeoxyribonuclease RuvC